MTHYLFIDLGTGNMKISLVSSDGEIIGIRTVTNEYQRDTAYSDALFFLPEAWSEKILACCAQLSAEFPAVHVRAVSSAGARQSIVLIDEDGKAFLGLPNIDNRGREFVEQITCREDVYRCSGRWVSEDFCAAKLLGLKMRRPEVFRRTARVVSLSEWMACVFTGKIVMEPSQACETQLYDLETGEWSGRLCAAYGIDASILPPLSSAGMIAGPVLERFIRLFGMDQEAVFIIGGADTQVALQHMETQPGEMSVISGTTSPVVVVTEARFCDPKQRVWTNANLGGRGFVIEMNPGITGLNYQRMKSAFCDDLSYQDLERKFAEKKSFCCTASFSSLLFYEKRCLRRGGFFMRSPLDVGFDRIDMMWAVLADIACSIVEQLKRLAALTGSCRGYIRGCGGGFQSETLCHILADLSGLELWLKPGFETATLRGLAKICNQALQVAKEDKAEPEERVYLPRQNSLIHAYYPVWLENRNKANLC